MNGDFIEALRQIEKEKEIPFATLLKTLEVALGKAYKKHYNVAGDVAVHIDTTKNAFSLEDTKRRVAHNSSYVSFMRKGRTAKEQADATRNETDDNINLGMHPYRYVN